METAKQSQMNGSQDNLDETKWKIDTMRKDILNDMTDPKLKEDAKLIDLLNKMGELQQNVLEKNPSKSKFDKLIKKIKEQGTKISSSDMTQLLFLSYDVKIPSQPFNSNMLINAAKVFVSEIKNMKSMLSDEMLEDMRIDSTSNPTDIFRMFDESLRRLFGGYDSDMLRKFIDQVLAYPLDRELIKSNYMESFVVNNRFDVISWLVNHPTGDITEVIKQTSAYMAEWMHATNSDSD